jgi:hypothetical protein
MDTVSDILSLEIGNIFGKIELKEKENNLIEDKKLGIIKMMGNKKFFDKKLDSIGFEFLQPADLEKKLNSLHDEYMLSSKHTKQSQTESRKSIPIMKLDKIINPIRIANEKTEIFETNICKIEPRMSKIPSDFQKKVIGRPSGKSVLNKKNFKILSKICSEEYSGSFRIQKNESPSPKQSSSYLYLIDKIYPITDREKENSLDNYKEYYNIHQENVNNMNSYYSNKSFSEKRRKSNTKTANQDQDRKSTSNSRSQKRPSFKKFFLNEKFSKYYSLIQMGHNNPKMSKIACKYLKETYNLPSPNYKLFTTLQEYQDNQTITNNTGNDEKSKNIINEKNKIENSVNSFPSLDCKRINNNNTKSRNIRLLKTPLNGVSTAIQSTNYKSDSNHGDKKEILKYTKKSLINNSDLKHKQSFKMENSKKIIFEMCEENIKDSLSLLKDNYKNYENQGNLIEESLKKTLNYKDWEFEKDMAKNTKDKIENQRLLISGKKNILYTKKEMKKK